MVRLIQLAGQLIAFGAFAVAVGYFASNPVYRQFPESMAQIKISFAHGAARQEECRRLSSEEIAKLPRNQRRPNTCSRERVPVHVQLDVDGKTVLDERLEPTGLANDGPSRIYRKITVTSGDHVISARLKDSRGNSDFDYEARRDVTLAEGQNLAIDFKADGGGFQFR